jgi:hypothetical protein
LKEIAIVGEDESIALAFLLGGHSRREEVVGLIPGALRPREAERFDELRQPVELVRELLGEIPPGLVLGQELVPVCRRANRVESDKNGARPLGFPGTKQHVHEPDDRVVRLPVGARDRLGERMPGAVREIVSVDC